MFSFPSLEKEKVSLIINISNGRVDASMVSFVRGNKPKFLYSAGVSFVGSKPDPLKLSDKIISTSDSIIKDVVKKGWARFGQRNKKISSVVVSLSSPWPTIKTKDISLSKEVPFIITRKFINDIVSKEEGVFKKELSRSQSQDKKTPFQVTEKSIIHAKINGYLVDEIVGKKTKNLGVCFYASAISKEVEQKISNLILRQTHVWKSDVFIHSFLLALFSVVRDSFRAESDFILVNINSETTDILLVSGHAIKSMTSFPFGKNTIIRQMVKSFGVSPEIAESQLIMYLSKKIGDPIRHSVQNILSDLEKEWSVYLEDALENISKNFVFPRKVFLSAHHQTASVFIDFLNLSKEEKILNFIKNMEVVYLGQHILSDLYQNDSTTRPDESLVLLASFYDKLIQLS